MTSPNDALHAELLHSWVAMRPQQVYYIAYCSFETSNTVVSPDSWTLSRLCLVRCGNYSTIGISTAKYDCELGLVAGLRTCSVHL